MTQKEEELLVERIKGYVTANLPLSQMKDEELEEKIKELTAEQLNGIYCPIEKRVSIAQQVYSSIRGFGILDTIMNDDAITEVMINGPDHIFIEKNGRLTKLNQKFELSLIHI